MWVGRLDAAGHSTAMKLVELHRNAILWSSDMKEALPHFSQELQRAAARIEIAQFNGAYRFNDYQIALLISHIKGYSSEIPADDMVKQLLEIGVQQGKPLSDQEMTDFYITTALMDKNGQTRVMGFMKAIKENEPVKDDTVTDWQNLSYEQFRKSVLADENNPLRKLPEQMLKDHYYERVRADVQYKAYTSQLNTENQNTSKFINLSNLDFVYGVAECEKPELLAEIVQSTGATPTVAAAANELAKAYEFSSRNMGLIEDLAFGFYPQEIKQIVAKLEEQKAFRKLSKYEPSINPSAYKNQISYVPDISKPRKKILENLGLTGQIKLMPLETRKRIKYYPGDCGRGKNN